MLSIKAVSLCSQIHSPYCLILQPNLPVSDTCILAESNQLIKYSSPSNSQSQTEALKQKPNVFVLFVMQHKLVGHFWWERPVKQKNVHFAGLAPPTGA